MRNAVGEEFGGSRSKPGAAVAAGTVSERDAHVLLTDRSEENAAEARRHLAEAGVADRVTALVGDALTHLDGTAGDFNRFCHAHPDLGTTILPLRDGLPVVRRVR